MSCTLLQMLVILNTNDGWTMQNDGHTMPNVGRNTHNVYQGPKGGLEEPPRAPGDPPTPNLSELFICTFFYTLFVSYLIIEGLLPWDIDVLATMG